MSEPSIEEVRDALDSWEFLKGLPPDIDGFTLHQDRDIDGLVLNIASYRNDAIRCRMDITYTSETFDYVPVKTVGLHQYRDIRFFFRDRDRFALHVKDRLPELVHAVDIRARHNLGVSIIFLDYSDFSTGDQIVFLYNRFRDEFFAETKHALKPDNITTFDCKSLADLEVLLDEKLERFLLDFK